MKLLREFVVSSKFDISLHSFKRKKTLWSSILVCDSKNKLEIDDEYDLFGNQIISPCKGSDDLYYDKKSMEYLFKKNSKGEYLHISYSYDENNIPTPNFPISSNGKILNNYSLL